MKLAAWHSAESNLNFGFVPVYQNWYIFRKSHPLVLDAIFPKKFDSGNYRSGESKGESLGRHVLRVHGNFSQKSHIRAEGGSNSESNGESFVCFTKKNFSPPFGIHVVSQMVSHLHLMSNLWRKKRWKSSRDFWKGCKNDSRWLTIWLTFFHHRKIWYETFLTHKKSFWKLLWLSLGLQTRTDIDISPILEPSGPHLEPRNRVPPTLFSKKHRGHFKFDFVWIYSSYEVDFWFLILVRADKFNFHKCYERWVKWWVNS